MWGRCSGSPRSSGTRGERGRAEPGVGTAGTLTGPGRQCLLIHLPFLQPGQRAGPNRPQDDGRRGAEQRAGQVGAQPSRAGLPAGPCTLTRGFQVASFCECPFLPKGSAICWAWALFLGSSARHRHRHRHRAQEGRGGSVNPFHPSGQPRVPRQGAHAGRRHRPGGRDIQQEPGGRAEH
jgi:hypothetical protein